MKELIEFLEKIELTSQADSLRNRDTTLKFYANQIGDEGTKLIADSLKANSTLTTLDLGINQIGAKGVKLIADSLKVNSTLTKLDLVINKIKDEGAKLIANSLEVNSTLTNLCLVGNKIGDATLKTINEYLKKNKTIAEKKAKAEKNYEELKQEDLTEIIEQQSKPNHDVTVNKVKEIIYDKPLLNHPKLLQAALDNNLSSDLIQEAINNNDEELVLAGLLSVGFDVGAI
ncbi:MAG TPA: hypothetical protein LFW21_01065 [Rickettsia endosymbiont of Pyrocoelia pectoralis]|nr:hypothetical protein [Rickettsia endosymbiont of Pyrocoelia pectoralis]